MLSIWETVLSKPEATHVRNFPEDSRDVKLKIAWPANNAAKVKENAVNGFHITRSKKHPCPHE